MKKMKYEKRLKNSAAKKQISRRRLWCRTKKSFSLVLIRAVVYLALQMLRRIFWLVNL